MIRGLDVSNVRIHSLVLDCDRKEELKKFEPWAESFIPHPKFKSSWFGWKKEWRRWFWKLSLTLFLPSTRSNSKHLEHNFQYKRQSFDKLFGWFKYYLDSRKWVYGDRRLDWLVNPFTNMLNVEHFVFFYKIHGTCKIKSGS